MITKKDWNSLSPLTRERAAKIIFFNMSEEFQKEMSEEWHHDIDVWHKALFNSLFWTKDKKGVKAVVNLTK